MKVLPMNEDAVATVGLKMTVGGGMVAAAGGMTATEIAAYSGAACALLGIILQGIYLLERNRRERARRREQETEAKWRYEEHLARMAVLKVTGAAQIAADTSLSDDGPAQADAGDTDAGAL